MSWVFIVYYVFLSYAIYFILVKHGCLLNFKCYQNTPCILYVPCVFIVSLVVTAEYLPWYDVPSLQGYHCLSPNNTPDWPYIFYYPELKTLIIWWGMLNSPMDCIMIWLAPLVDIIFPCHWRSSNNNRKPYSKKILGLVYWRSMMQLRSIQFPRFELYSIL